MARFAGYGLEAFCFDTEAALAAIDSMLAAYEARGRLTVLTRHKVVAAIPFNEKLASVTVVDLENHVAHQVRGWMFIDATETGELLPLAGIEFSIGDGDSAAAYDTYYFEDTLADESSGTAVLPLRAEHPGTENARAVSIPREPRRMKAMRVVDEDDIGAERNPGPRAAFMRDSIGIGYSPAVPSGGAFFRTAPFQIPLGALLPANYVNVVVGGPAVGATPLASAVFRIPQVLLALGESAGLIAEFCAGNTIMTHDVAADDAMLLKFQQYMVERRGIPLYWYDNILPGSEGFVEAQMKPFLTPGFHESLQTLSYPGGS
jgi:hypothetical protein